MAEIQSIREIIAIKGTLKESLKDIDVDGFSEYTFGYEGEYTYKSLLAELRALLTDITTLTKNPKQFLKLSTYGERNDIRDYLNNVNSYLDNPGELHNQLEPLKSAIRPFHIRYTKNRYVEFNNELSELTRQKQEFEKQLNSLKKELTTTTKNKGKSDAILNTLTEQQDTLTNGLELIETKRIKLDSEIATVAGNHAHISNIKAKTDSQKEVVDNFVEKIVNREQELENQTIKTAGFNEKLEAFTTERDELLITAQDLIEVAKTSMRYGKAEGIAASFRYRLHKLEPSSAEKGEGKWWVTLWRTITNPSLLWILGSAVFVAIAIFMSYEFIEVVNKVVNTNGELSFNVLLAKLSTVALPIAAAWFCAGQYTKIKNIAEDYAYKTALAESIIGFSEQLKDDENDEIYKDYMKIVLEEMHHHPLRNHKKYDESKPDKTLNDKLKDITGGTNG